MKKKRLLSKVITILLIIAGMFVVVGITNPQLFLVLINILWLTIFFITLVVVILGVLTFLGLKKEASRIIDMFLEGSITLIELGDFVRELFRTFKEIFIEFLMIIIPYLSYALAILIYFIVLFMFKLIGLEYDVTIPTIILSFIITLVAGFMTLPRKKKSRINFNHPKLADVLKNFKTRFVDAFEVVIFVLFLTIDVPGLFFLPEELQIPLEAQLGEYDLMVRGIDVMDHFSITMNLIIVGIAIEILRQVIRLTTVAKKYYSTPKLIQKEYEFYPPKDSELVKGVLRETVNDSKDDFLMFAAFTVFITFVFLFFPRLKLLALISASTSALLLDLIYTERLATEPKEDLLSRVFQKLVGLRN